MTEEPKKLTKKELIDELDALIARSDDLPQHAMLSPITHADYYSLMLLLSSIFRAED